MIAAMRLYVSSMLVQHELYLLDICTIVCIIMFYTLDIIMHCINPLVIVIELCVRYA